MKVEFEFNVMGTLYLLVAVALVTGGVMAFVGGIESIIRFSDPLSIFISVLILAAGILAVGLLVPVVKRVFKAFMPSA